ncbi:MAG: hypothetical protein RLZZ26_400 [Candidatus Parcubacteria bacterium]|jgi:hypothetical protein
MGTRRIIVISPTDSQKSGILASIVTGLVVCATVWIVVGATLDFWYLDQVIAPAVGIGLGLWSAFAMYTQRQFDTPLNQVGVRLWFGKPTGEGSDHLFENGRNWVWPFMSIRNVPASTEKFPLKMPGEKFNAQDGNLVYFGISPEEPEKRNRIQYSVMDATRYIAVEAPEDFLREAYVEEARVFFGQASKAIGVRNEQTLFSDYIVLPPKTEAGSEEAHRAFEERLTKVMFTSRGGSSETERLFTDDAIKVIMANAGEFRKNAATWGIGDILAFTPSVRENPEMEQADAERQATTAKMDAVKMKAAQIKETTKGFLDSGVNPDLAALLSAKVAGEDVSIDNRTVTVSGLPEVIKFLGDKAIDAFAKAAQATPAGKPNEGVK